MTIRASASQLNQRVKLLEDTRHAIRRERSSDDESSHDMMKILVA